jgi:purine-cytosine permease-like protein
MKKETEKNMQKMQKMMEEQYRQLREDWRHYDKLIWGASSIVITITGIMIGIAYGTIENLWVRAGLLGVAAFWTFTLFISIVKHRFFQSARSKRFQMIENNMGLERTPVTTCEARNELRKELKNWKSWKNWFKRRSGYRWLAGSILGMFLIAVLLFICTILQIAEVM